MKLTSKQESLYKTITYRIISIVITYLVVLLIVDSYLIASGATILSQVTKAIFYYCHERLWTKIGRESER